MRKYITKASERIGVESTSRDGKRAQVVSYSTCENFIIRFCDGKEMKLKNWRYFIEGNFNYEKHFKAPRNREERIGEKKVMNNGLTAEVIEYRGSHDMDILFEDGGKRTGVSWRDFCIGNIAHPTIHGGNVSQNELVLRFYLESLGFVRIPQRSKRSDRVGLEGKELDLYNDKLKIAIEYDGEYSHTKNKDDEGKNKIVEKLGIKLYRFREPGCSGVSGRNYILEDSRFMSASLECCLKSFVRDVLKKDDKFINFEKDKRTIKEYVSNNKRATIHLYEKKKMNNGMVAEIIKMSSCRNITVQFEDGEIVYHKCYQSFVKGNISHIIGLPVQTDKEYKDSLIKNIFGSGGKAILSVVDKHGKRYSISRIQGERVNILDEVGNDLNITALSLFDGVQYFGQKDLSSSSDHENCLLEKFVSGKVGQKADVDSCVAELITAVTQLLDVGKIPAQIEETTTKKAEVEHRMSIFKEKGVDAKLKKQTGYTKDREKLIAIQAKISSVLRSLYNSYKSAPMLAEELQGFESEYNKDIFVAATNVLTSIDHQLQQIGNTIQQIQSQSIEFETVMKNLTNRIDSLADEFAEIKREINDESLDVDAFVTMTADLERYKNQLKALEEKATSRAKIEMAFKKAARERNEILLTLFKAYKTEVERINGSQNELKIQIEFKGDRETFKNQLKSDFRGTSISDAKYQVISEKFNDYVAIVEDWILNGGKEMQTIISSSEYAKLSVKLQEQYSDLIKRQVMNKVEIYYHEKLLRHHSIGQRASALILFILAQSDNDIILIDQPEDDLDNKIIYDEVISSIVKKKQGIQFIFATHNANIPVLGDAERVFCFGGRVFKAAFRPIRQERCCGGYCRNLFSDCQCWVHSEYGYKLLSWCP